MFCGLLIFCGVLYSGSLSGQKHSGWGSCGSLPQNSDPISIGRSPDITGVQKLPSFASNTQSKGLESTEFGLAVENSRGQEVDSPNKNRARERLEVSPQAVRVNSGTNIV